jgi:formylglycine-generating enzyme required for sulfatase activity
LTTEHVRFAVWSDNLLLRDQLPVRLRDLGESSIPVTTDSNFAAECLVVVTDKPLQSPADLATWIRLANQTLTDIVAYPAGPPGTPAPFWPGGTTLRWGGKVGNLEQLARTVADLLRPAVTHFARLPTLFPSGPLPGVQVATTRPALIEQLAQPQRRRVVPVSYELYDDLRRTRAAINRQDYDLVRLMRWSTSAHSRSFVNLRIGRPNELANPLATPRTLDDVVYDPLGSRLVVLLGEPGSGKTVQLRYFDAQAALRSIRAPDEPWKANSFYVALSEQPAEPNISVDWLAQRWQTVADVKRWYAFDQFLEEGGTVLLDGLNEGGMRAVPLERWMLQWRGVVHELLEWSAVRVVLTCRSRDLLIPLRPPSGEPPTSVTVLPLSRADVVAIATQDDPVAASRLDTAMTRDPSLAELYSSPFRLRAYLDSGAAAVATTGARLFGLQIAAAFVREWEHLTLSELVPLSAGADLAAIRDERDADPWPILSGIPLIKGLGALGKALSFPVGPDGQARLTMPADEAGTILATALRGIGNHSVDPSRALQTALNLDILGQERMKIRFAHPSLQHLFAAFGCTVDEIVALAESEQRYPSPPNETGLPPGMTAPSYADHRYEEVFEFAAQLRGTEIPDRLLRVDPVRAARAYLSIRPELESPAAGKIVEKLEKELDGVRGHRQRSAVIAALGDLGWRLPGPRRGGTRAMTQVPAGEWRLGLRMADERSARGVASEFRLVELPAFRISRFPVANAEYAEFIDHGGYDDKLYWTPEGWEWRMRTRAVEQFVLGWSQRRNSLRERRAEIVRLLRSGRATPTTAAALVRFTDLRDAEIAEYARGQQARPVVAPRYWEKRELKNPLQPVVGISWFEANAFCEWLSRQLGAVVRLASENEWESACLYSLGLRDTADVDRVLTGDFANTGELKYPATTPIGTFAAEEQTRQRLPVEFLGNVFEWVFDHYAPGDHNRRIVKGGSWRHDGWRAHPAYRGRGDVDTQNDDIGFRYVIAEGQP